MAESKPKDPKKVAAAKKGAATRRQKELAKQEMDKPRMPDAPQATPQRSAVPKATSDLEHEATIGQRGIPDYGVTNTTMVDVIGMVGAIVRRPCTPLAAAFEMLAWALAEQADGDIDVAGIINALEVHRSGREVIGWQQLLTILEGTVGERIFVS